MRTKSGKATGARMPDAFWPLRVTGDDLYYCLGIRQKWVWLEQKRMIERGQIEW